MVQTILIVDADTSQCAELQNMLEAQPYKAICSHSMDNLQSLIDQTQCRVLILDLDTLLVGNRVLRDLKTKNPGLNIIGLSSRAFHPELKEAMAGYIHACVNRPVDPDELNYWVRTILEDVQ